MAAEIRTETAHRNLYPERGRNDRTQCACGYLATNKSAVTRHINIVTKAEAARTPEQAAALARALGDASTVAEQQRAAAAEGIAQAVRAQRDAEASAALQQRITAMADERAALHLRQQSAERALPKLEAALARANRNRFEAAAALGVAYAGQASAGTLQGKLTEFELRDEAYREALEALVAARIAAQPVR